jgi:hypothetical protein
MKKLIALVLILISSVASAKDYRSAPSLGLGIGFTVDPETFLMGGKFDFPLGYGFSLGPLAQIGLSGDEQLYGFSGNIKYTIAVPDVPRLLPSLEAGAGVLVSHFDKRNDETETSFLIVLGGGLDYMLTDHLGLGGHVYANPAIGSGEDFFVSFLFGLNISL